MFHESAIGCTFDVISKYDKVLCKFGQQQLAMVSYACGFDKSETGKYFEWIIVFMIILSLHSNERLWGISYSHSWKLCKQRHHWADVSCIKGSSLTAWSMLPCANARWYPHPPHKRAFKISRKWDRSLEVSKPKFLKESSSESWTWIPGGKAAAGEGVHVNPNTFFDGGKWVYFLGTMKVTFLLKVHYHPLTRW